VARFCWDCRRERADRGWSGRQGLTSSPLEPGTRSAVYQTIHDQLVLDGNSQQNLAHFCTTWIEPEVKQLMDESADKNMIDKDEYRRPLRSKSAAST